jgi:hypothetical protein
MKNVPEICSSMRSLIAVTILLVSLLNATMSHGQTTCTLSGTTVTWDPANPPTCTATGETGTATGKDILIVPVGTTLTFNNNNGLQWTGMRIEVAGTVNIAVSGQVYINASLLIKSGGTLRIDGKLNIGDGYPITNCPFTVVLESNTSKIILPVSASEKLRICNNEIVRGASSGGCNSSSPPSGNPPYCQPDLGFEGPISFNGAGVGGPLPVELLFFKAFPAEKGVDLKWATASEKGAQYFAIEKSLNGKNFTEIGIVDASGNTIARMDYSFFDDNALLGRNYYRLKEVDFDGTYEYFNITFADTDGTKAVSLYPNPVQTSRLQFKLNFASDEQSHAKIYNSTGALVSSFSFSGTHYNEESNLKPGAYVLKVSVGNELFTQRFVIP